MPYLVIVGVSKCSRSCESMRKCAIRWESVYYAEKVQESVLKAGKVWKIVQYAVKIWKSVQKAPKVLEGNIKDENYDKVCYKLGKYFLWPKIKDALGFLHLS